MKATLFIRPLGGKQEIDIIDIKEEDKKWFEENKIKVSIEDDNRGNYILYSDAGFVDEENEPVECIHVASIIKPCNVAMSELKDKTEKFIKEMNDCGHTSKN
jgi:hypothetical protein